MTSKIQAAETRGIGIGMAIAAAIVADMDPTKAEEIIAAAGMTTEAQLRAGGVEDYDIAKLKEYGVLEERAAE